ncbi:MAG: hypothetical protein WAO00_03725, partial [Chthoniobacterales bacterium]
MKLLSECLLGCIKLRGVFRVSFLIVSLASATALGAPPNVRTTIRPTTVAAPTAGPLSGTFSVPGDYPSLTNPGGIFEAINTLGASGNITINIVADLSGETGSMSLNEVAGGFSVLVKPSGAARTISGTGATTSLIKLNGADNVTFDGSLSGGTDRSLTLTSTNPGGTVFWLASTAAPNGANNNTIKNCNISGGTGTIITWGILAGSGTTLGAAAEAPNSNNTIQNNAIFRVQNSTFISGNVAALDQNWLVAGNTFGSTVAADKNTLRGMFIGSVQNFTIANNTIAGISSIGTTSATMTGIQVGFVVNGGTIRGNKISDIKHNDPAGWGSNGIWLGATSTASNVTISNNFISDVASQGWNGQGLVDNGYGIVATSGGGYKIYHNSILLNTNQGVNATGGQTAALNVTSGMNTPNAIDLRDNILANIQPMGTLYSVICNAPRTVFSAINYNDYFAPRIGFISGSPRVTLADWRTATFQDANSKADAPLFVRNAAPADLHLSVTSPVIHMGFGVGVTNDIDGEPRNTPPDIGADEIGELPTPTPTVTPTPSATATPTATPTATATPTTSPTSTPTPSQPPTLGNYPNASIRLSTNTRVTPDSAPANTTSINVSTDTRFKGRLEADPATGLV